MIVQGTIASDPTLAYDLFGTALFEMVLEGTAEVDDCDAAPLPVHNGCLVLTADLQAKAYAIYFHAGDLIEVDGEVVLDLEGEPRTEEIDGAFPSRLPVIRAFKARRCPQRALEETDEFSDPPLSEAEPGFS